MAALAFDTLKYVKQLTAANVPVEQAEAQAEALRTVLDATLTDQVKVAQDVSERAVGELDSKTERGLSKIDRRCDELDAKIDRKFGELDAKIDRKFGELDTKIDIRYNELDAKIDLVRSDLGGSIRLLHWMFGIQIAGIISLVLKAYF